MLAPAKFWTTFGLPALEDHRSQQLILPGYVKNKIFQG